MVLLLEVAVEEKFLGATRGSDFTFEEHINNVCQNVIQKLYLLYRISQYLSENKKRVLFKAFITLLNFLFLRQTKNHLFLLFTSNLLIYL